MLFKGGNDCVHILADVHWPMWDEKEKAMARLIGEFGLAIAIWGCADITLGMLEKLVLRD